MDNKELLEKLVRSHESVCTIQKPYSVGNDRYDAYAFYDITGMKYVLVKNAELWRQNTKEHIFFLSREEITAEDISRFQHHVTEEIEPELVRQGGKTMPKDHMLTYITAMFISGKPLSAEAETAARKLRFFKNYSFGVRGYCEARIAVFDIGRSRIIGNPAAKIVMKTYKKVFG
jgi:hypothetical protein